MSKPSAPSHAAFPLIVIALVLAAAAPAAAHTTTVSRTGGGFEVRVTNEPSFQPKNMISVAEDASGNLLVTDIGQNVDVVAGQNCSQQTVDRVACPPDASNSSLLSVTPGAGDDEVGIDLPVRPASGVNSVEVFGGPDNDIIVGSAFHETLDGDGRLGNGATYAHNPATGPVDGNDLIAGGGGPDTLIGGNGRDYLAGMGVAGTDTSPNTLNGGPGSDFFDAGNSLGPDRFIGGSGSDAPVGELTLSARTLRDVALQNGELPRVAGGDTVSYGPRTYSDTGTAGVTADLDGVADDGATGEGDQIDADVEALVGTIRNDRLTGSAGVNRIEGRLGTDTLLGGAEADKMLFRDGVADTCFVVGAGDTVDLDLTDPTICQPLKLPRLTTIGSSPVDETMPYMRIGSRLRRDRADRVIVTLRCERRAPRTCSGRLGISRTTRGKPLAQRRFRARPGRRTTVRFRLPPSKEAALMRARSATLKTVVQGTSSIGPTTTIVARRF
jgi:hypothetical protein